MHRYNRHIILPEIGQKGQDKITNAKVLVVGAGGLGCPILQYLAAAGVGTLGIIDFDVVDITNLQRQVLYGSSSLGENKAIAAKKRLNDLNDSISINAYAEKLSYQNALDIFNLYDIIVDGSDNFETRYLVNDACVLSNKPLIFGAIYKFEGQVSVFNYQNGPTYRCLFPEKPKKDSIPNCAETGVLGVLPGIIGSMQANEVLKIILGIGQVLSGKLFCYHALTLQNTTINIKKSEKEIENVLKMRSKFHLQELHFTCHVSENSISIQEALKLEHAQFIDVREAHELPKITGLNVLQMPLSDFENQCHKLNSETKKLLFCQSGIRSKKAVEILKNKNIHNCFSINEGASEIYKSTLKKSIL